MAGLASVDFVVVGGGIVGLAVSAELLRRNPTSRLVLFEQEEALATQQSGRNSGVVHSGIYYAPGSLKARLTRDGRAALIRLCEEEHLPYDPCGKVIVASREAEIPALDALLERGRHSGVLCERIGPERLAEIEPACVGVAALLVPEAGIVDFRQVCERLAARVRQRGGRIELGAEVRGLEPRGTDVLVHTGHHTVRAARVITCGGLHAARLAALSADPPDLRIVPFRGEYLLLRPGAQALCRGLIYPVPDPELPFLGVHFTRRIDGEVLVGPNALLSTERLRETLAWPGTWRLFARHWRVGLREWLRSTGRRRLLAEAQRLVPGLTAADLVPGSGPSGVRAQAVDSGGRLLDDFSLHRAGPVLHVLNAPSPAATAALAIAEHVADAAR